MMASGLPRPSPPAASLRPSLLHSTQSSPSALRETLAGDDAPLGASNSTPLRRRYSMEEDLYYDHVMGAPARCLSHPPAYGSQIDDLDDKKGKQEHRRRARDQARVLERNTEAETEVEANESPPLYQTSVHMEGVFAKKHEIENTTKRAEGRHWHTVYVTLNGTALNMYTVKKDWGWGRSRDGPTICPDNPPWMKPSKLEKSYSLLHADAGIAADYTKRRYVIRIRAETDQFLLSCIELSTFIKWLECLFAAIDVAAPIDDRDFPRDMSIPRIQRIRWFQGQSPAIPGYTAIDQSGHEETSANNPDEGSSTAPSASPSPSESIQSGSSIPAVRQPLHETAVNPPPRIEPISRRLSNSNYANPGIDPHTGKWFPEHRWSSAHDLLYAKLCYSNLLFRSPRKSNYIISKGKQWFVDWGTGKMVRVQPPTYGEIDFFGPWQVIHTENSRI